MDDDDTGPTLTTEVVAGPVWSRVMNSGPKNDTTPLWLIPPQPPRRPISNEILDQMEKDLAAGRLWDKIAILEEIREEFGIGWAIYCSAFMGSTITDWTVDVCEALHE